MLSHLGMPRVFSQISPRLLHVWSKFQPLALTAFRDHDAPPSPKSTQIIRPPTSLTVCPSCRSISRNCDQKASRPHCTTFCPNSRRNRRRHHFKRKSRRIQSEGGRRTRFHSRRRSEKANPSRAEKTNKVEFIQRSQRKL